MQPSRPLPAFADAPPELIAQVRDVLRATGFDAQTVSDTVRVEGGAPRPSRQLPLLLRLTSGGRPVDTLIRLFVMGVAVDREVAEAAMAPTSPEDWVRLGLVDVDADRVAPAVTLRPWDDLIVASDPLRRTTTGLPPDFVMGISPSTQLLAQLTVREEGAAVLDIGTGCGFQGLIAAGHASAVTVTDVNPRALAFARLNGALNGVDLDVRSGSLYEPVAGRRFDLIVSNAPFIISPSPTHYFLHGGMEGDGIGRALARGAREHLTERGYCQFLANWLMPDDGWMQRLGGWFEDSGCDVWVMQAATHAVEEYAATWIEVADEETELVPAFDAWMEYFSAVGAEQIGFGLVTMQPAPDGRTRVHLEDGPVSVTTAVGGEVAGGMERRRRMLAMSDDEILNSHPLLSRDTRLEQHMRPVDGGWEAVEHHLRRTRGLGYRGRIDGYGAILLGRFEGTRPLHALLTELAEEAGVPLATLSDDAIGVVRRMYEQGMLDFA